MAKFTDRIKDLWNPPYEEYDIDDKKVDKNRKKSRGKDKSSLYDEDYEYDEREKDARDPYVRTGYYPNGTTKHKNSYQKEYDRSSGYSEYNDYDDYGEYGDYDRYDRYDSDRNSYVTPTERDNGRVFNVKATTHQRVVAYTPESFSQYAARIADELIASNTVLLNLENTPRDESRRIIDFLSGCAYMSDGNVQRVSQNIFIISPDNVELAGELIDELVSNGLRMGDSYEW